MPNYRQLEQQFATLIGWANAAGTYLTIGFFALAAINPILYLAFEQPPPDQWAQIFIFT